MLRPLLSIVVSFVASALAFPLAWWSGGMIYRLVGQFGVGRGDIVVPALLLAVACILLLAVGGSLWLSGLGALLAGAVHLLAGLTLVLWPLDPMRGVQSPVLSLIFTFFGPASELGIGATVFVGTGAGLTVGAILVGAGLARLVTRPTSRAGTIPAAIVGTIVLLSALAVVAILGGTYYREYFLFFRPTITTGLLLVLLAVLAGVAAFTARWSAAPLLVAGALTAIAGIVALAVPQLAFSAPFLRELLYTATAGTLLTVGVLVLGAGLGIALARRRADVGAAPLVGSQPPPPTGQPSEAV